MKDWDDKPPSESERRSLRIEAGIIGALIIIPILITAYYYLHAALGS
jgi:hypothetical protein